MELREAIEHCKEKIDCTACGQEHKQLAAWLEELKLYKDTGLTPEEIMDGKMLTGWIPVEERLPEVGKLVLVTTNDTTISINLLIRANAHFFRNAAGYAWEDGDDTVIAWMPLPEPYKPPVLAEAGAPAGDYADNPTLAPAT